MKGPGKSRTQQNAHAEGNVIQVGRDLHVTLPPAARREVEWPVRVGRVPPLAAAFQPRTPARKAVRQARAEGKGVVLSQVLTGDGGVGKSQLAASLARELRDQERGEGRGLDLLVWVNATKPDQIIATYAETATKLQLPGSASDDTETGARAFLDWLTATKRRWLIVLDDITAPETVDEWWPDGDRNGWVLATTRRRGALLSGQGRKLIDVDLYSPREARSYLLRRLTDAGHSRLYDPEHADQLADELGYLPLALGHAAAYIINKRLPVADYLTRFRDTGNQLSDLLPTTADTEAYGRPVTTALLLTLEEVETTDTTHLARPLLELISLMDPAGHPCELWTTPPALEHLSTARPDQRRHHPDVTQQQIHDALECLCSYAVISQDAAGDPIRIHALTARAVRETIPARNLPRTAHSAADALIDLWPEFDHQDKELSAALRSSAVQLDQHTHPALWTGGTHECIHQVSSSLTSAGLYAQALAYDQTAVERSTDILGPDHPDTLNTLHSLATSYADAGRTQDALHLIEQVLADCERILGPNHPHTLATRNNLANSYSDVGRHHDALKLAEKVVADRERILGPDHPDTLHTRHNLANSYSAAGLHHDALKLAEKVVADRERILGPDHPHTLNTRNNLANSYSDVGRHHDAHHLKEQVLADRERILGPDHPHTLETRNNLAASYSAAGRTQDALHLKEQVLADRERILGPDHPHTLHARGNLAISYHEVGRHQDALHRIEQVLADCERILGPDHPDTLATRGNLATSYHEVGHTQDALHLRGQVVTDCERILGPDHPLTLATRHNLAVSYSDVGRHQDALHLKERVVTDCERILGPEHPDTLATRGNLAISYSDVGRHQDALHRIEQVLADCERILGPEHPHTLNARNTLAQAREDAQSAELLGTEAASEQPDPPGQPE